LQGDKKLNTLLLQRISFENQNKKGGGLSS
jgi:hypothetical protein